MEVSILPPQPLSSSGPASQRPNAAGAARPKGSLPAETRRELPEPAHKGFGTDSAETETGSESVPLAAPGVPQSESVGKAGEGRADSRASGVRAAYLRYPVPRYPEAARRAGEQGTVTLRVLVTREGLPARVAVETSSGSAHLDHAALEAVKAWRFTPAVQGGARIESWMLVPVVFRLEGTS